MKPSPADSADGFCLTEEALMSANAMLVTVISIGHLSLATRSRLEADGIYNPWLVVVKLDTGYMACLDALNGDTEAVPADLQAIQAWLVEQRVAGMLGSTLWVRLDESAAKEPGLPFYDESETPSTENVAVESKADFERERMVRTRLVKIEWWNDELEEPVADHQGDLIQRGFDRAAEMIDEGFHSGELLAEFDVEDSDEVVHYRGWWQVLS
jgi:hypothetical protein